MGKGDDPNCGIMTPMVPPAAKDPLGDRMKGYEAATRQYLPPRSYVLLRLDGRSFHTWTRGLKRPYDEKMMQAMAEGTELLCREISGAQLGYTQSDEITIVMCDFAKENTQPWFGGNVQKITSVSASLLAGHFARAFPDRPLATFDARVFAVPSKVECANAMLWRLRDAQKNSISMLAGSRFSSKQLHGKTTQDRIEMLAEAGVEVQSENPSFLNGQVVYPQQVTGDVTWTDKRTGEERVARGVTRQVWKAESAPEFDTRPGGWLDGILPDHPDHAEKPHEAA